MKFINYTKVSKYDLIIETFTLYFEYYFLFVHNSAINLPSLFICCCIHHHLLHQMYIHFQITIIMTASSAFLKISVNFVYITLVMIYIFLFVHNCIFGMCCVVVHQKRNGVRLRIQIFIFKWMKNYGQQVIKETIYYPVFK
jgi:hypothetical protein